MASKHFTPLTLEIKQSKTCKIYSFAVDGKHVELFASTSRLARGLDADATLSGYQRTEITSHIEEIRRYLESPSSLLPNGIIVAFDSQVRFTPLRAQGLRTSFTRVGLLTIPAPGVRSAHRPGYIVDGQQRVAAIRESNLRNYPISVTAFICDDITRQREQFLLLNSTRPLARSLVYEQLPYTSGPLPGRLHKRRQAAEILERLNYEATSPLYSLIRTSTNGGGIISDNAILHMLEDSLTDGVMFFLKRDSANSRATILRVLFSFWSAVRHVFPSAWGLPPRRSRLMHGAGIRSVGCLLDHIGVTATDVQCPETMQGYFIKHLQPIARHCAWTAGEWSLSTGPRGWNEIQNTSQDVAMLSDHLRRLYDRASRRQRRD